ncbi:hypothetical protein RO3G_08169 [Rhizopus delemar RA 99-880]|uniref:Uncharacterized protein n=1 Tax=Rhizopus delemar (strain RA 99-880 / ATCC MYA-4621 / FGSC 9543 / NRRL 43880) TaxID=246409 RepID=I1C4T4_RHIO9|nr:hypothetical protein RO3G_08169 [Rhizopus delemar RA 99-880]|eukprot:EIE83464.1 hypothetical protein RO3G_08169 [Rhizopus delemar RA 99-880]
MYFWYVEYHKVSVRHPTASNAWASLHKSFFFVVYYDCVCYWFQTQEFVNLCNNVVINRHL